MEEVFLMCGITGIVQFSEEITKDDTIGKMTGALAHRGPDASGYVMSTHVHLGHRRLAIIDLEQGAQPMQRTVNDNTYTIVYNGELYNTLELKEELEQLGYHFTTDSDTEVLLVAFIAWGINCTEKLNGIFAFAVFDAQNERLTLFRDRLGVKPLFYTQRDGLFLFASEIKGLLAHADIKPQVGVEGLSMLLSMGPSRVPGKTVFENIYELEAAHLLIIDRSGVTHQRYWNVEDAEHHDTLENTAKNVRELVTDAVHRQLVSDVPLCTLLSGGIDSSIISMLASQMQPLHTYSLDYEGNEAYFHANDFQKSLDTPWIELMVNEIGSTHQTVTLSQENLAGTLNAALYAKDYPSMADIDGSLLLFFEEIKKDFKVALSGECADELFGGYPWFHKQVGMFPWITSIEERERLLKGKWRDKLQLHATLRAIYEQEVEKISHLKDDRQRLFYLNQTYFMQTLLERKDRMSMAKGLEVRVPFADHRLVEYVWNIPWEMKQFGGLEKGILRHAFKGQLPDEVLYRKKNPFPKTHHPAYAELVQQGLLKRWQNPQSILRELFEEGPFEQLIATRGESFKKPWFGQLMTGPQLLAYFIQLDEWFTAYEVELIV